MGKWGVQRINLKNCISCHKLSLNKVKVKFSESESGTVGPNMRQVGCPENQPRGLHKLLQTWLNAVMYHDRYNSYEINSYNLNHAIQEQGTNENIPNSERQPLIAVTRHNIHHDTIALGRLKIKKCRCGPTVHR